MTKSSRGDQTAPAPARAAMATRTLRAPITDRVNAEPAIFNGMTSAEGSRIAAACLFVYGLLGVLLLAATGIWPLALVLVLLGSGATLWYASLYLAKVKRGRPESYYVQAIHLWLAARKLTSTHFLRLAGYSSLGRAMPLGRLGSSLTARGPRRPHLTSEPFTRPRS